jgi:protein TonB
MMPRLPIARLLPLAWLAACAAGGMPAPPPPAAVAAVPPAAGTGREDDQARRWFAEVSAQLEARRYDPRDPTGPAAGAMPAGRVVVRFGVDALGRIRAPEVSQSSGQPKLDAAAVILVMAAQPLPPPPSHLLRNGTVPLAVPVQYPALQQRTPPVLMPPR